MTLDPNGVLLSCPSCGTTNRLRYDGLGRASRCPKCQTGLPLPAEPIDVQSTADFDAAVNRSALPIVVDFWAAWCGPCRMVAPEIKKAAGHLAGRALVLKVDTDANPELSSRFGIRSIPTIGVFSNGREVNRGSGVRAAAAIEALVPHRRIAGRVPIGAGFHPFLCRDRQMGPDLILKIVFVEPAPLQPREPTHVSLLRPRTVCSQRTR